MTTRKYRRPGAPRIAAAISAGTVAVALLCGVGSAAGTATAQPLAHIGKTEILAQAPSGDEEEDEEAAEKEPTPDLEKKELLKFFCEKKPRSAQFYADWDAAQRKSAIQWEPGKDPLKEARMAVAPDSEGKLNDDTRDAVCDNSKEYSEALKKAMGEAADKIKPQYEGEAGLKKLEEEKTKMFKDAVEKEKKKEKK